MQCTIAIPLDHLYNSRPLNVLGFLAPLLSAKLAPSPVAPVAPEELVAPVTPEELVAPVAPEVPKELVAPEIF